MVAIDPQGQVARLEGFIARVDARGRLQANDVMESAATAMLDELGRLTRALGILREEDEERAA